MIEVGYASHAGLQRESNEDSYWADTALGLFLVVDGMGGHGRGDVAAATARDALVDAARAGADLASAIRQAGAAIAAFASRAPGLAPTGATLALLKIDGDRYEVVRVGDARAYLWRHGMLTCLGVDDPADAGDGAPAHPRHNPATQALGITPPSGFRAEPLQGTLERGMQFLLCTDGLSEELDDLRIAATVARTDLAAQECADHLLLGALDAGGRDNVTVLLVRST